MHGWTAQGSAFLGAFASAPLVLWLFGSLVLRFGLSPASLEPLVLFCLFVYCVILGWHSARRQPTPLPSGSNLARFTFLIKFHLICAFSASLFVIIVALLINGLRDGGLARNASSSLAKILDGFVDASAGAPRCNCCNCCNVGVLSWIRARWNAFDGYQGNWIFFLNSIELFDKTPEDILISG